MTGLKRELICGVRQAISVTIRQMENLRVHQGVSLPPTLLTPSRALGVFLRPAGWYERRLFPNGWLHPRSARPMTPCGDRVKRYLLLFDGFIAHEKDLRTLQDALDQRLDERLAVYSVPFRLYFI